MISKRTERIQPLVDVLAAVAVREADGNALRAVLRTLPRDREVIAGMLEEMKRLTAASESAVNELQQILSGL